jgi:hypothetical protein
MNKLFTLGYTSTTPEELKAIAEIRKAFVLDIRFSRYSRAPRWREGALADLLSWTTYRVAPSLGNRNYNNGGSIQIYDLKKGMEVLKMLLDEQPVILLCACHSHVDCHRAVVAEEAVKQLGVEVEHLYGSRKP